MQGEAMPEPCEQRKNGQKSGKRTDRTTVPDLEYSKIFAS